MRIYRRKSKLLHSIYAFKKIKTENQVFNHSGEGDRPSRLGNGRRLRELLAQDPIDVGIGSEYNGGDGHQSGQAHQARQNPTENPQQDQQGDFEDDDQREHAKEDRPLLAVGNFITELDGLQRRGVFVEHDVDRHTPGNADDETGDDEEGEPDINAERHET